LKTNNNKLEAIIGVTYRCHFRCKRCHTWKFQSKKKDEITLDELKKLPDMAFANITGGEPFLRQDINEIGRIISEKCKRVTIVTGGYFTKKVLDFSKKNPQIGIRVSLEGLSQSSNSLRGLKKGFDYSMRTLIALADAGLKDLGFSITLSDENYQDLLPLYQFAKQLKWEFATAVVHNSYYFHKLDNKLEKKEEVKDEFFKLMEAFLRSKKIKNWFRAWFVGGIINSIDNKPRLLKCAAAKNIFYLDPYGEVYPCNVRDESLGNLKVQSFEDLWGSEKANRIRKNVINCDKQCWMIGSVADQMKSNISIPAKWVIQNKLRTMFNKPIRLPCP
jgi:MoaA/NifB/PqqE/SkfB family radical SAM enzyme